MSTLAPRWRAAVTVAGRDLRSQLFGLPIYAVVALILLGVSHFGVRNALWQVTQNGLLVLSSPVSYPYFLALWLASIYLGLVAALAIARERDGGTLEVLFYGPIDSVSYLMGKFLQALALFAVIMLFYLLYFLVTASYANLAFTGSLVPLIALSLALSSIVVAFGLVISAATRRVFVAVLLFLVIMLFFTLFDVAYAVLMSIPGEQLTNLLAFARTFVDGARRGLAWISPLAYFERGTEQILMGETSSYAVSLVSSLAYAAVLMGLAVVVFDRKGVRQ